MIPLTAGSTAVPSGRSRQTNGRIHIGKTTVEMLENDREQERGAIELYGQIIDLAGKEHDDVTIKMFRQILSDEEKHHRTFSNLLGKD